MLNAHKRQIWSGLVDYANADLESNSRALKDFGQTLFESMPWMAHTATGLEDVPEMIALEAKRELLFGEVRGKQAWIPLKAEEELRRQFLQQALEYQPQVRQLLRWLTNLKGNRQDRPEAFRFLLEHTKHIEFERGDPAFAPEEEASRYFTPGGNLKEDADFPYRTLSYKDIADVICDFIHNEFEPGSVVPIQLCKRSGCGNLVATFKKREYCRTAICDRERQKRDSDLAQRKNRDNVFVSRLRGMPLALRRKKTRQPETIQRLRQIENDWKERSQSLAKHALKLLTETQGN